MTKTFKVKRNGELFGVGIDTIREKRFYSKNYFFHFNKDNGILVRTDGGESKSDPELKYGLPEIVDMEISTVCSMGCDFCYKGNTKKGHNMSFETFKKIFQKLPKTVTQIAFGIGDIDGNPDIWNIFQYT